MFVARSFRDLIWQISFDSHPTSYISISNAANLKESPAIESVGQLFHSFFTQLLSKINEMLEYANLAAILKTRASPAL